MDKYQIVSAAELVRMANERKIRDGKQWGNWRFMERNLTLAFAEGRYEVDLERIHDSASMLDWIFQVSHKNFATPQVLFDLIQAFDEIFQPQKNLCSFGWNKVLDPSKHFGPE